MSEPAAEHSDGEESKDSKNDLVRTGAKMKRGRRAKPKIDAPYTAYEHRDIVNFISLVEEREELWNPQNKDWSRRQVRMKKFAEVEKLCQRFMSHNARKLGKFAEKLWEEITADYAVHLNRVNSGASGANFQFAPYLNFSGGARQGLAVQGPAAQDVAPQVPAAQGLAGQGNARQVEEPEVELPIDDDDENVLVEAMREEMAKTREVVERMMEANMRTRQSERICNVYAHLVAGKSEVEKIILEARIIGFMSSLLPRAAPEQPPFQLRR